MTLFRPVAFELGMGWCGVTTDAPQSTYLLTHSQHLIHEDLVPLLKASHVANIKMESFEILL